MRHHHEHWDGTGYPDGLAGEAIPLEARILAVADAYEAMTGKRTHRKRLAAGVGATELEAASGTQFDPAVVEAFLACSTCVRWARAPGLRRRPGAAASPA